MKINMLKQTQQPQQTQIQYAPKNNLAFGMQFKLAKPTLVSDLFTDLDKYKQRIVTEGAISNKAEFLVNVVKSRIIQICKQLNSFNEVNPKNDGNIIINKFNIFETLDKQDSKLLQAAHGAEINSLNPDELFYNVELDNKVGVTMPQGSIKRIANVLAENYEASIPLNKRAGQFDKALG